MLVLAVLASIGVQRAVLERSVPDWCSANDAASIQSCEKRQIGAIRSFFRRVGREPLVRPEPIRNCMYQSAKFPSVDWVAADRCLDREQTSARWRLESDLPGRHDLGLINPPAPTSNWVPIQPSRFK